MTLRQSQILEALLAVEESRPGRKRGIGAHPDEVRRELTTFRPAKVSADMIRRELRALPFYVRERGGGWRGQTRLFTLTADGRVKAHDLAAARARLRREAAARSSRNRQAREVERIAHLHDETDA